MKGTLESLRIDAETGALTISITTTEDVREELTGWLHKDVTAEIRPWKPKRSLDANAYAWVLIGKLAKATGLSKLDIYREAIRHIGGADTIVTVPDGAVTALIKGWTHGLGWFAETEPAAFEGYTTVVLYSGSSSYDTAQMSALIRVLVQDAESIGIPTMTPDEEAALMAQWERAWTKREPDV